MKKAQQEYPHLQYCVQSSMEAGLCRFNDLRTFLRFLAREKDPEERTRKSEEMRSSVRLGIVHAREESKILREVCLFRC